MTKRLKKFATARTFEDFEETEEWFRKTTEMLEDLEYEVKKEIERLNDITRAFEQGSAKWDDESIDEEIEYVVDQISVEPLIDVKEMIEAFKKDVQKKTKEWKQIRGKKNRYEEIVKNAKSSTKGLVKVKEGVEFSPLIRKLIDE